MDTTEARRYRKKPVEIEAVCFDGSNAVAITLWMGARDVSTGPDGDYLVIRTLEGEMRASLGDYIIRGVQGEFYPCKPDIFEATYESADAVDAAQAPGSGDEIIEVETDPEALGWFERAKPAPDTVTVNADVLAEVAAERSRQDAKWGEQNHFDGTGGDAARDSAAETHRICQAMAKKGVVAWKDILHEEVWEAFAEDDPQRLRSELIQVAAVAVQWAQAIDRRAALDRGEG